MSEEPVHFYIGASFASCGEEVPHGKHNSRDRAAVTCAHCLADLLPAWPTPEADKSK